MDEGTCKELNQPWLIPKEIDICTTMKRYDRYFGSKIYLKRPILGTYNRTNEVVDDDKTFWKRGDIIKFPNCYIYPNIKDWQEWFLLPPEKKRVRIQTRIKNPYIPVYASNQYAILMNRYRVTKEKSSMTYRDYGSHIMMLSGKSPGRMRRYYAKNPFRFINSFPYDEITSHYKNAKKYIIY